MPNTLPHFFCFNPLRRDHARLCRGGFYDVETSDRLGRTADYLKPQDACLVATPTKDGRKIEFAWFSFLREEKMPDPEDPTEIRVLFGTPTKSETLSRADAITKEPYKKFFRKNGGFKIGMTIMWGSEDERLRRQRERRRARGA